MAPKSDGAYLVTAEASLSLLIELLLMTFCRRTGAFISVGLLSRTHKELTILDNPETI